MSITRGVWIKMNAKCRFMTDRFWPVFLICLGVGLAELTAFICVCLGQHETAAELDSHCWLWFMFLWLPPVGETLGKNVSRAVQWFNSTRISNSTVSGKIVLLIGFIAAFFVLACGKFLPEPWAIAVHGAVIGPFLLIRCWSAWRADISSENVVNYAELMGIRNTGLNN